MRPQNLSPLFMAAMLGCAEPPDLLPVDQAPTPTDFNLEVSAIVPSVPLTLTASGLAGPGIRVHFVSSAGLGTGPCTPDGSACLDIAGPVRLLGSALTDATGEARLDLIAPATMTEGATGYIQATARAPSGAWSTSDVEAREVGDLGICGDAEERPHDPALPEWSYHGVDDGPDDWGSLPTYGLCGTGTEQTPIELHTAVAAPSGVGLTFVNYGIDIPLDLLNNGHTLEVDYTGVDGPDDPQITYGAQTWYLKQFHVHSTSEHTLDGMSFPFELHLVHKAADGSRAVVGVFFAPGGDNEVITQLLENDPGHHMATTCTDTVPLYDLLPASDAFFHYHGSLTTPPCDQGLDWFVMAEPLEASEDQSDEWQFEFGGTTNRPLQPLGTRTVDLHVP